ncbi:CAP domain-containing protein [Massiliimalia timonensis]|uniref:CAP domain-containing protein n=1 Tax=Massiliimalia timonensis TaxID=1987501 RepID=UPI001E5F9E89|nr:CAP domain-containing protein [Massiliimalia timonensis]
MKQPILFWTSSAVLVGIGLVTLGISNSPEGNFWGSIQESTVVLSSGSSRSSLVLEEKSNTETAASEAQASSKRTEAKNQEKESAASSYSSRPSQQKGETPSSKPASESSQPAESISRPSTSKPSGSSSSRPIFSLPNNITRPESSQPESSDAGGSSNQSYAEQVVKLVNQERAKAGLQPLSINRSVEAAALVRAKETEKSFSHTRPDGRNFSTALTEKGVSYRTSGENIAWGQRTPEQVMNGWMNSSGHRANILNSKYTSIGVGYYRASSGKTYWTQIFIG